MKGKYKVRAVVTFTVEADNRAAAHIVAVDALTAAELDGFDLANLDIVGSTTTGDRAAAITFVPPAPGETRGRFIQNSGGAVDTSGSPDITANWPSA